MNVSTNKLQLKRYFLPEFSFGAKANVGQIEPKDVTIHAHDLTIASSIKHVSKDNWLLVMEISLSRDQDKCVWFSVIGVGEFHFPDSTAEKEKIIRINGFSVLFSAIREVVRQFASFGPYPRIFLPIVTFNWDPEQGDAAFDHRLQEAAGDTSATSTLVPPAVDP